MLIIRVKSPNFDPKPVRTQLHVSEKIANEYKYTWFGQYCTLDLEMHRNFPLEKEVDSKDGVQGWRARVESQAKIVLLGKNLKKATNFRRKLGSWQRSCRRVSPTCCL